MAKKEVNSFEEKMNKLKNIVEKLEKDDINLDASISLYEEGLELSNTLKEELNIIETKINKISKEKNG